MSDSTSYKPGDQANGFVLTADGEWVPVNVPGPTVRGPSLARKIGMGIVWIALVGWVLIGTVLAMILEVLVPDAGQSIASGPIVGIGIGIYLHMRWLRTKSS